MDRDRFDTLTRLLATPGSRRAALGTLLGAGLLGTSLDVLAKKNSKDRGKAKGKDKDKKRKQQRQKRARAEAAAGCCQSGNCSPGSGKNLTKCCYEGQTLTGKNFKSSNLTRANFKDAKLRNAKFQSSNLTGACFVGADITGANFKQANLSGVVFCRTTTSSGEDNSGCDRGTPCCPTCTSDTQCGDNQACCDGRCVAGDCCDNGERSTCNAGELCCANQCLSGVCCDAEDCRPRGNLCVSAGGGPTNCICGSSGGECNVDQTCCPPNAGPTNAGACVNLQTSTDNCGRCGNACGPTFACAGGQCVCPTPTFKLCGDACIPESQCCLDSECPVCQQCTSTGCQNAPDRTISCDRSPLVQDGLRMCTTQPDTGVCVGGACNCAGLPYDGTANVCRCNAEFAVQCTEQSCQGCQVFRVCVDPVGSSSGSTCIECP